MDNAPNDASIDAVSYHGVLARINGQNYYSNPWMSTAWNDYNLVRQEAWSEGWMLADKLIRPDLEDYFRKFRAP